MLCGLCILCIHSSQSARLGQPAALRPLQAVAGLAPAGWLHGKKGPATGIGDLLLVGMKPVCSRTAGRDMLASCAIQVMTGGILVDRVLYIVGI